MKLTKLITSVVMLCALCACGEQIFIPPVTPAVFPSSTPRILSPTPIILMASATTTFTPLPSTPSFTPTITQVPTLEATSTPTPSVTLPPLPAIGLEILGCDTSLDILHQMGEVTNAYPVLRNAGPLDMTNVCATLSASDEGRLHPDKTSCVASLPAGYQVILKLTVDTTSQSATTIRVDATSQEGSTASVTRTSCTEIGLPEGLPNSVGRIEPIH
jgi:hypothetical protein